jgi:NADH:ubiquinone oxidoreductase subunit 5 (subunit L)/multisubunit Na+/H+ antiporter MnhA subunit
MPLTAVFFFIGAVAISGLPPLNGFISELLVYLGAFRGVAEGSKVFAAAGVVVLVSLTLIGALAAACFTKAFGSVFLGEPREILARAPHDPPRSMTFPMGVLAFLCVLIGLLPALFLPLLKVVLVDLTGGMEFCVGEMMSSTAEILWLWTAVSAILVVLAALLYWVKVVDLKKKSVGESGTWDCGYAAPTARMQYTASSFAENFTTLFSGVLHTRTHLKKPEGFFPKEASFHSETPDFFLDALYRPLLRAVEAFRNRWKTFQQGRIQIYLLYLSVTLLALLVWGWLKS